MSSIASIFEHYGFKTREQQLDIIRLLYLAGCFDSEILKKDLKETNHLELQVETAVRVATEAGAGNNKEIALEKFKPDIILDKLFVSEFEIQNPWPHKIHNWLIQVTQREFFARKPGQERWQQETGKWMQTHENEIRIISDRLDLEKEVTPQKNFYNVIAVFGSAAPEMKKRLEYAKKLIEQYNIKAEHIFLLCGERPADKQVDGCESYLNQVALNNKITIEQVTETHLMQDAYNQIKGNSQFANISVQVIDTPKGQNPRPTTVDTLHHLIKLYPNLTGSLLFISRAPHIQAQAEDVYAILAEALPNVKHEVAGGSAENTALNRLIGALGGFLYGGYPRVAIALGANNMKQELEVKRKEFGFNAQMQRLESSKQMKL